MRTASFYVLLACVTVFAFVMLPFEGQHGIPYAFIAVMVWFLAVAFVFRCPACRWPMTLFRDPGEPSWLGVFAKLPDGRCSKCGLKYDRNEG